MAWIAAAAAVGGSLISSYGANKAAKKGAASADRAAELAYKQSLPWDVKGMFGSATFDEGGRTSEIKLDPEMQKLYDRLYGRAGGYGEQVAAMGDTPLAVEKRFYDKQKAISAPGEERERLALESRLLAQGMLGSTGGAGRMQTLLEAQGMKDLVRRSDAASQSQQLLDLYRTRETGDIKQAVGIGALPYDYASLGRGIGGGMSSAAQYGAGLRSQGALNRADTSAAGWGSLGKSIGQADWGSIFGSSPSTGGTTYVPGGSYTGSGDMAVWNP